jgi:hypothetical protein
MKERTPNQVRLTAITLPKTTRFMDNQVKDFVT